MCEVCSQGVELEESRIEEIKQLNQATLSFLNQQITQEQYKTVLGETPMLK
jgi:hypothetical protein